MATKVNQQPGNQSSTDSVEETGSEISLRLPADAFPEFRHPVAKTIGRDSTDDVEYIDPERLSNPEAVQHYANRYLTPIFPEDRIEAGQAMCKTIFKAFSFDDDFRSRAMSILKRRDISDYTKFELAADTLESTLESVMLKEGLDSPSTTRLLTFRARRSEYNYDRWLVSARAHERRDRTLDKSADVRQNGYTSREIVFKLALLTTLLAVSGGLLFLGLIDAAAIALGLALAQLVAEIFTAIGRLYGK